MKKALILTDFSNGVSEWCKRAVLHADRNGFSTYMVSTSLATNKQLEEVANCGVDFQLIQLKFENNLSAETDFISHYLADLSNELEVDVIVVPPSHEGRQIGARLAVGLHAALIADGSMNGDNFEQSTLGGKYLVTSSALTSKRVLIYKSSKEVPKGGLGDIQTSVQSVSFSSRLNPSTSEIGTNSTRPDLTEAAIVISGGRGITESGFSILEELADLVGGAVGASRAAVDAGWYPPTSQIGQTGKSVSPDIYVAVGISGAIQHKAGMQTSKKIVAINVDPEAPIFEISDISIVGDFNHVITGTIEQLKNS